MVNDNLRIKIRGRGGEVETTLAALREQGELSIVEMLEQANLWPEVSEIVIEYPPLKLVEAPD